MTPLVVVEGSLAGFADAIADARGEGWTIVRGWWVTQADGARVVCAGEVASAEGAAAALLAAVGGAGVIVHGTADRDVLDRLCDDLRRLGPLDHRTASTARTPRLTVEERALVDRLLDGATLGEAARSLNLSRRTADRRMSSVRAKLGVHTTAEVLVRVQRATR